MASHNTNLHQAMAELRTTSESHTRMLADVHATLDRHEHRDITSSRLITSSGSSGSTSSGAQARWSAPRRDHPLLADPPMFSGTADPPLAHWLVKMRAKLLLDGHLYDSEHARVLYTVSRLQGHPLDHVLPRLDMAPRPRDSASSTTTTMISTPEHVFGILERAYMPCQSVRDGEAYLRYWSLRQCDERELDAESLDTSSDGDPQHVSFVRFWEQFQRHAAPLNLSNATLCDDLLCRVSEEIRTAVAASRRAFASVHELADFCAEVEFTAKEQRALVDGDAGYATPFVDGKTKVEGVAGRQSLWSSGGGGGGDPADGLPSWYGARETAHGKQETKETKGNRSAQDQRAGDMQKPKRLEQAASRARSHDDGGDQLHGLGLRFQ